jgi:ferric-dicitrate binding protein FerR (iron transport regulator)
VTSGHPPDEEDAEVRATLEQCLQYQPLDEEAFARIRAAARAEFRAQYGDRARTRWRPKVLSRATALAAALAGIAIAAAVLLYPRGDGAPIGVLARTAHGELVVDHNFLFDRPVRAGGTIFAGRQYTSAGSSLIALAKGGALRLAAGSVVEGIDARDIRLDSGRVFLDFPGGAPPFVVHTSRGTIEHIGTQFEVKASAGDIRIRVREGIVRMRTTTGTQDAGAGTEVVFSRAGPVESRKVPTYGPDWEWAETIAPEFDIEGQPLAGFLDWVARETGRRIQFADDRARDTAQRTRLHGSIRGLAPLEALGQVLSTTTLRFEVRNDIIRISSQR